MIRAILVGLALFLACLNVVMCLAGFDWWGIAVNVAAIAIIVLAAHFRII